MRFCVNFGAKEETVLDYFNDRMLAELPTMAVFELTFPFTLSVGSRSFRWVGASGFFFFMVCFFGLIIDVRS